MHLRHAQLKMLKYFTDTANQGLKPETVLLWQEMKEGEPSKNASILENTYRKCLHAANYPKSMCTVPDFCHFIDDL